jgi:hypothetical protein
MKTQPSQLVNTVSLARRLRLPIGWLHEQAENNLIPALKVGGEFYFNYLAVEQVLLERTAKGGGRPHAE